MWWRRLADRWTPDGLRAARVDPGRRGAVALTAAMLTATLVMSGLVWRARPRTEPVAPPPVVVAAASASGAAGSAATATPLVVAVTGRVRRPGVVTVPAGARVIDALRAAGGPLPGADLAMLNLARKLTDGELVAVGVPGAVDPAGQPAAGAGPGGSGASAPIDLNTATLAQLDTLPGVGPVLAQRILDWRTEHGRFASVDQVAEVPGIGETRLSQLRDLVRV
jgi:competence protein ComEA